jgi:hypothetical protein
LLRRCDVCGEESWRPLDRVIRGVERVEINARLPDGRRADMVLWDEQRFPRLVVQLDGGGSGLPDRSETVAGAPLVVLAGPAAVADPMSWRPLRERNLRPLRCRCALARVLPVDDGFSLRVIGCPINLRREQSGSGSASASTSTSTSYALVIQDCGRCAFFVGIGYAAGERRRVTLHCAFGSPLHDRFGPSSARRILPPPQPRMLPAGAP